MRKLLEFISNLFAIIMIGMLLAKLRLKTKYLYLVILGTFSICLGVGFGVMILAILGFDDVGGNIYSVLYKYSIIFGICSLTFIYFLDKVVMFIQENILNCEGSSAINLNRILLSFLLGAALITYFFIVPDPIKSISLWAFLIGTIVYGLRLNVGSNVKTNNQNDGPTETTKNSKILGYDLKKRKARDLF